MMVQCKKMAVVVMLYSFSLSAFSYDQMETRERSPEGRRGPPPFVELDLDGNGELTLSELEQHDVPHGDHATLFDRVDVNGDGAIIEDEWRSHKPPRRGAKE